MDTVRNLLYSGKTWKQSFVKAMKWLPTAIRTAMTVPAMSHHFSFPLYRNRPRTNRNLMVSDFAGSTACADEPPLKFGIIRFGSSSQP